MFNVFELNKYIDSFCIVGWAQVGAAVASAVISNALSPSPSSPAPAPPAPAPMPTANSQDVQQAQAKSIAAQVARRGRASTILTGDSGGTGNTLGA